MTNILFVSETKSFTVTSLSKLLEGEGYNLAHTNYNPSNIEKNYKDTRAVILNAEDYRMEGLVYIKDKIIENEKPVLILGDTNQIQDIEDIMPIQFIKKRFLRPINVKEASEEIHRFLQTDESHLKKKILVVDDSGAVLRNVKGLLEEKYQVILANSGAMAIKYLGINIPDLILLDYEMPVCDGKQVLEMIRTESEFANIPVIFLTNKNDKDSVMSVAALKPEGYLLKSLQPAKLLEAINDFFEKRKWDV